MENEYESQEDTGSRVDMDAEVRAVLDRYERKQLQGREGGMSTVSRIGGRGSATSIIAQTDAKGVFKGEEQEKIKEVLIDLVTRTNFRDRNERIYFLDWVSWCEEFTGDYSSCLLYLASARSEKSESINQLISALTRIEYRSYNYGKGKDLKEKTPGDSALSA